MSSIRSKILSVDDIKRRTVPVPEWDVTIEIRSISASERARIMARSRDADGELNIDVLYPLMLIYCAFDPETGERIFTEDDIDILAKKNGAVVETLAQMGTEASGIDVKAIDSTAGN